MKAVVTSDELEALTRWRGRLLEVLRRPEVIAAQQIGGTGSAAMSVLLNYREFYAEVASYLRAVKTAWRNPTMHVAKKYTEEEANEIFAGVRRL